MGITWTMTMIAIILMGLRTYTNFALVRNFGWDYFWATVTLVRRAGTPPRPIAGKVAADAQRGQLSTLVGQIMQTVAVRYGLCNHIYFLTPAQIVAATKWTWLGQIVVLNAIGFGKIAIVAFLLRVQDGTHSKGKWFLYFVAVSGVIVNINQTVLMLTQCDPSARTWDKSLPGHCNHVDRTVRVGDFQGGMWSSPRWRSSPGWIIGQQDDRTRLGGGQRFCPRALPAHCVSKTPDTSPGESGHVCPFRWRCAVSILPSVPLAPTSGVI